MRAAIKAFADRLFGRGSAAITVPVMDGAFKANRILDEAEVLADLPDIDDIASDGTTLWASAGSTLYRLEGGTFAPVQRFESSISAIAVRGSGAVAVALDGKRIRVMQVQGATRRELAAIDRVAGVPLVCVNAMTFDGDDRLVFSDGSQRNGPDGWCRDLMELGQTGRVCSWNLDSGDSAELAGGLEYAYGVLASTGADGSRVVRASESWRHRVVSIGGASKVTLTAELPGYPSRMTAARGGGFWLACFVCRTQLVEFVLREPAYRKRMLAEVDPRYWISPSLSSGHSFLEPLQGAGVKSMGVMKPWAPPRSYGLVLRVASDGQVLGSLHSQVDGRHHGITGVVEHNGRLLVASKGSGKLLAVPIDSGLTS
jgi:hypothetical protein